MTVVERPPRHLEAKTPTMLDKWLVAAKDVLRATVLDDRKRVRMHYRWEGGYESHKVERLEDFYLSP
jgi:hypothetical protein